MTADSSYSLEALERRWQLEKTPQVGLRLAEEYRRKGDLAASIEALATGLEVYPTHTASRVALSRYLVDAERFEEAVPHLEQIVALDPAHLVANKLLVGAYVGVNRIGDARDKLDIYEMMGEGDTDIERLHDLLDAAERRGLASSPEPVATEAIESLEPPADLATVSEAEVVGAELAFTGLLEESAEDAGRLERAPVEVERSTAEPFGEVVADEPFGSALTSDAAVGYWQEVAEEGIFVLDPREPGGDERGVASEATPPKPLVGPTATLGELYLEQGHRREAVEVFEHVLKAEPGNEAARQGLEVAAGPKTPELRATSAEPDRSPNVILERKKQVLTTYRAQLRQAVEAGV